MALEEIAAGIRPALERNAFSGSLKFDCGDQGVIVLADGTATTTDRDGAIVRWHHHGGGQDGRRALGCGARGARRTSGAGGGGEI